MAFRQILYIRLFLASSQTLFLREKPYHIHNYVCFLTFLSLLSLKRISRLPVHTDKVIPAGYAVPAEAHVFDFIASANAVCLCQHGIIFPGFFQRLP